MTNEIAIKIDDIPAVFVPNGLDPVIQAIRDQVVTEVPDASTPAGRKRIASAAHRVARSKTYLDDLGKNLVAEAKAKIKAVDAERKRMRDQLDDLKAEVRQPLTAWEDAEKARQEAIKEQVSLLTAYPDDIADAKTLRAELGVVENFEVTEEVFQEFLTNAYAERDKTRQRFLAAIKIAEERERVAAERKALKEEQAKLAAEKAEAERKEREARIAREAEERARREAEEKAMMERESEQRRLDAEKKQAEEAARRKVEAAKRAELEAKLAAERAEREKREAVERERARVQAEKDKADRDRQRREADKARRQRMANEIAEDIRVAMEDARIAETDVADEIAESIMDGAIRHVTWNA